MAESSPSTSGTHNGSLQPVPFFNPASLASSWGSSVQQFLQSSPVGSVLEHAQRQAETLHRRWARSPLGRLHREAVSSTLQGPWHPMLASISLGGGPLSASRGCISSSNSNSSSTRANQGPNVLIDTAMAKDEVKARLAPIPVYTVANPKNEFVLVAGEVWLSSISRGMKLHS